MKGKGFYTQTSGQALCMLLEGAPGASDSLRSRQSRPWNTRQGAGRSGHPPWPGRSEPFHQCVLCSTHSNPCHPSVLRCPSCGTALAGYPLPQLLGQDAECTFWVSACSQTFKVGTKLTSLSLSVLNPWCGDSEGVHTGLNHDA